MYKLRFRVQMNYEAIMQLTELFSFMFGQALATQSLRLLTLIFGQEQNMWSNRLIRYKSLFALYRFVFLSLIETSESTSIGNQMVSQR